MKRRENLVHRTIRFEEAKDFLTTYSKHGIFLNTHLNGESFGKRNNTAINYFRQDVVKTSTNSHPFKILPRVCLYSKSCCLEFPKFNLIRMTMQSAVNDSSLIMAHSILIYNIHCLMIFMFDGAFPFLSTAYVPIHFAICFNVSYSRSWRKDTREPCVFHQSS